MDIPTVVLGLMALLGCGAAVWLALGRSACVAEAAAARARAAGADEARDLERAERERVEARESLARETLLKVSTDRAAVEEQLQAEREAHRSTREVMHRERMTAVREVEERLTAEIAHAEAMAQEKFESVRREKQAIAEQLAQFEARFREVFGSLAGEALKSNREQFLALAEQKLDAKRSAVDALVTPIAETLKKTDAKLAVIEAAGEQLKSETGRLVKALREPHVRGRYGEVQLRRVAELAGMAGYCDFCEQDQTVGPDGQALRPDMIVRLPSNRTVVVDAKTNIQAYIDAAGAPSPEEAERQLDRFARHVAEQAAALGKKKYWAQYDGSPEFVVMFIPGDQFVDAALSRQPEILERAAQQGVILASPSTLIGPLRAVAVGYKEEQLARHYTELRELGKELHERVATAMGYAAKLGKSLTSACEAYNDFVGSYEKRLEPAMRRFEEGGVKSGKDLPEVPEVGVRVRRPALPSVPVVDGLLLPGIRDGSAG
jgi:DNA recombination protein RmuC